MSRYILQYLYTDTNVDFIDKDIKYNISRSMYRYKTDVCLSRMISETLEPILIGLSLRHRVFFVHIISYFLFQNSFFTSFDHLKS